MGVSEILSDTFARLRERFWGLLGIWFVFFAIMMAALVVFFLAIGGSAFALAGSMESGSAFGPGMGAGMVLLIIVFYLVYLLIAVAQYAAMNAMASPIRNAGFGDALNAGFRSSPTLLVVMVLLVIGYFVFALIASVLFAALAQLGSAATVIGAIALFAAILYLACRLAIVFPIVPVDGVRNPFAAIGRSWNLTRGNALAIFLAFVVFGIIAAILFAIVFVPSMGSFRALEAGDTSAMGGAMIFMFLGFTIISILIAIGYSALLSSVHARLAGDSRVAHTFE
jgi:hypothetical protein